MARYFKIQSAVTMLQKLQNVFSSKEIVSNYHTLSSAYYRSQTFSNPLKRRYLSSNKDSKQSGAGKSNSCNSTSCQSTPDKWPTGNRANFHFHPELESILNEQLNAELKAFYYYLSMASYFGRVDVALPGCESFFMQMHHEEHEHAIRFLNYITMRGGMVNLYSVNGPEDQDWKCPLNAFKTALQLEIDISDKLVSVNCVAEKYNDLNASDFIVTEFMEDQMKSINEMARLVTVLSGVGDQALARFMFDKDVLDHYVKSEFDILKKRNFDASKDCLKKKP
ncbi:soma ferritin-like [Cephus cinctus]|uniref:Ferritin n=1 Tax=Cephus cinctus TaxID=211228 RepID=A0AAJ7BS82_CEPCN|nr:soma ferritin-like [Cephus cinctus]